MTGLSRCGRPYPTLARALLAAELRAAKSGKAYIATGCETGADHWHVILSAKANGAAPDPFPPVIRALLVKRDECCQRCGWTGRLEAHHRRAKASGGSSARAHTQCACNGVMLCRLCHGWVHANPRKARARGLIVLQSASRPATVSMAFRRDPYGDWNPFSPETLIYPTCEGGWNAAA